MKRKICLNCKYYNKVRALYKCWKLEISIKSKSIACEFYIDKKEKDYEE